VKLGRSRSFPPSPVASLESGIGRLGFVEVSSCLRRISDPMHQAIDIIHKYLYNQWTEKDTARPGERDLPVQN
jgi:hypothetical protein